MNAKKTCRHGTIIDLYCGVCSAEKDQRIAALEAENERLRGELRLSIRQTCDVLRQRERVEADKEAAYKSECDMARRLDKAEADLEQARIDTMEAEEEYATAAGALAALRARITEWPKYDTDHIHCRAADGTTEGNMAPAMGIIEMLQVVQEPFTAKLLKRAEQAEAELAALKQVTDEMEVFIDSCTYHMRDGEAVVYEGPRCAEEGGEK